MVIYSVTVAVDPSIVDAWIDYMKKEHIPDVLKTGCFLEFTFCRVIGNSEENKNSYNIQYHCHGMADMHRYQVQFGPALQQEHIKLFGDKAVAFRTLLEEI